MLCLEVAGPSLAINAFVCLENSSTWYALVVQSQYNLVVQSHTLLTLAIGFTVYIGIKGRNITISYYEKFEKNV